MKRRGGVAGGRRGQAARRDGAAAPGTGGVDGAAPQAGSRPLSDGGPGPVVAPAPAGTVPADHTASGRPFSLGRRPPLTGLRALALALVLVYHANFSSMPGAWAGVVVFFVLSGFLITALLSAEGQRTGRIDLQGFYARRGVRLLPSLFLTVALLAIYATFVSVGDVHQRVWGDIQATVFYYSDYRQALGHEPLFGFLAQCWSLSIEEQFYVVWSVLMVAAVATGKRPVAYALCIAGLLASLGDRLWLVLSTAHFDTQVYTRAYYAFDTRADALFLGCLLGLIAADGWLRPWTGWPKRALQAAALASTGTLVWLSLYAPLSTRNLLLWWLPLSAVAATVLVAYFVVVPRGWGSRFAGLWPLVFVGELSYTIYLVHFPVYLALEPGVLHWPFWWTEIVRLAVVFVIAVFSWFCIERPLMRWYRRRAARAPAKRHVVAARPAPPPDVPASPTAPRPTDLAR